MASREQRDAAIKRAADLVRNSGNPFLQRAGDARKCHDEAKTVATLADWCDVLAQIVHEERGNVLAVREGMAVAHEARRRFGVSAGPVASDARARVADTGDHARKEQS